jgi:hypothetical protein
MVALQLQLICAVIQSSCSGSRHIGIYENVARNTSQFSAVPYFVFLERTVYYFHPKILKSNLLT